ncbi:WD domain-containing protein [Delitschia confertaspora ATCC 74209]|uniref:WD domain-containing protein n=1 Tax=Delitschia confertaspora ATCC 74209 TaxID=1513339 RepID=A0A9P4JLQ1_9PLEO|nr:WD domain-containing protein [Delitschia confertaspora ATCC 74209]
MSLTPSHPRMMSPALGGIKLTPNNSPFVKSAPLRSPVKSHRSEVGLSLKQVIGTTANSANAFDSLPFGRSFAFIAGAAAVLATVDDEHQISQRFYRARPTTNPINPSTSIYGGPATPTQNESRNRTVTSLRESGLGASPLASPGSDWTDSPANKAWNTRERIKAATCVSFSPDGRLLAVGEAGYKPRVLIFSTAVDAPSDTPLTSLSDHTFGVRCIAFSPDSQYLASLGSANDGFLYIWNINSRNAAATLYASNKCTSNVTKMAWLGTSLITVGTRHVKVWRTEEPAPAPQASKARQSDVSFALSSTHKTLHGRNCLLGSLLEANFTSVVAVAPGKAIVSSDRGDICLIDDTDGTQRFSKVADAGFGVTSMAVDTKGRLHLASSQGGLKSLNIHHILCTTTPPPSPPPPIQSPMVDLATNITHVEAIGPLLDMLVTVDSHRSIHLSRINAADDESLVGDVVQRLPAHCDSVLGVEALATPNSVEASFFTWSAGGSVFFWGQEGACKHSLEVPLEQIEGVEADPNELKVVSASVGARYVVTGDKYGVLRIIGCKNKTSAFSFKAHASEITDIAIFEKTEPTYVACSGRDRTVQVFIRRSGSWDLLQTLDEHVGAVTRVLFSRDGTRLVSSSSDRTLVVRELVSREEQGETIRAFIILRTVVLKTTPTSLAWDVENDDMLWVSTIDRHIHKYDLRNAQSLSNFRATDSEGGDAVVLSSLVHLRRPQGALIAGVSSTDKSVRIYDESGSLLARDWGHTEGVTDIALVITKKSDDDDTPESKSLVTVAADGTIFVWSLDMKPPQRHDLSQSMDILGPNTPANKDLLATKPPLRRVFSQSELARFQRSPDEETAIPSGSRSPKLRKKLSKFSLAQAPKLEPSPCMPRNIPSRTSYRNRSPSPPSPRHVPKRRSSMDTRARSKASGPATEFGSISASTESLCRTLRAYRKRLANSSDSLSSDSAEELERELALTVRAVGDRAKSKSVDESTMVKLLDQYSERLVTMLDEKIAASVAMRMRERENSESAISIGTPSPAREMFKDEDKEQAKENNDDQGVVLNSMRTNGDMLVKPASVV